MPLSPASISAQDASHPSRSRLGIRPTANHASAEAQQGMGFMLTADGLPLR